MTDIATSTVVCIMFMYYNMRAVPAMKTKINGRLYRAPVCFNHHTPLYSALPWQQKHTDIPLCWLLLSVYRVNSLIRQYTMKCVSVTSIITVNHFVHNRCQ